jgi:hypothetical protein
MLQRVPFQAFVLNLENGDRFVIEHPENVVYSYTPSGEPHDEELWLRSQQVRVGTTLEAVTSIGHLVRHSTLE